MEPLKIGNITLPHRAVFGPMAGFTDAPCRRLMAQHGAGFTVSEMVSSRALVYGDHKTVSLLKAAPNGAPYGVQIFGVVPEIMGEAPAAIEQYEFDFVDINMGCPAPKIVSGGAGSKLMLDPDRCGRIVEQVVAHTKRPVTVKMRKGWDADHITAVECAKACEQAGAALVAVHARTREQMYTPGIDPEIIARVKDAVKVPVLGNGDIRTAEDAVRMVEETGCDGVMIGRATYGRPWIFREVKHYLATGEVMPQPSVVERVEIAKEHLRKSLEIKGEHVGILEMRRHLTNYFKGLPNFRETRLKLVTSLDIDELFATLDYVAERWGGYDLSEAVPAPLSHDL